MATAAHESTAVVRSVARLLFCSLGRARSQKRGARCSQVAELYTAGGYQAQLAALQAQQAGGSLDAMMF